LDEAIKLWLEYRDKDINYKNWWNMKDNIEGGILNKDFIKKHLQRETELEDKVFDLENKIKELKKFKTNALKESIGVDDIGARLLTKIAMRMSIDISNHSYGYGYGIDGIGIGGRPLYSGIGELRVDGVEIDNEELEYLRALVEPTKLYSNPSIADGLNVSSLVNENTLKTAAYNAMPIVVDAENNPIRLLADDRAH
jgi:hypothetical protein